MNNTGPLSKYLSDGLLSFWFFYISVGPLNTNKYRPQGFSNPNIIDIRVLNDKSNEREKKKKKKKEKKTKIGWYEENQYASKYGLFGNCMVDSRSKNIALNDCCSWQWWFAVGPMGVGGGKEMITPAGSGDLSWTNESGRWWERKWLLQRAMVICSWANRTGRWEGRDYCTRCTQWFDISGAL